MRVSGIIALAVPLECPLDTDCTAHIRQNQTFPLRGRTQVLGARDSDGVAQGRVRERRASRREGNPSAAPLIWWIYFRRLSLVRRIDQLPHVFVQIAPEQVG